MVTLALTLSLLQHYNSTELEWARAVELRDWQKGAFVLSEMKLPSMRVRENSLITPEAFSMLVHRFPEVVNMRTQDGLPAAFCFATLPEDFVKRGYRTEGSLKMLEYFRVFVLAGGDLGAKQGKKSLSRGTDADATLEVFINWAMPEILPQYRELVEISNKMRDITP